MLPKKENKSPSPKKDMVLSSVTPGLMKDWCADFDVDRFHWRMRGRLGGAAVAWARLKPTPSR